MKTLLVTLSLAGMFLALAPTQAAEEKKDAKAQLEELVDKIRGKLGQGKPTEATLADEIKQFDALLEEHKGEKTEEVANILTMKATLYTEVFENTEKGIACLEQVRTDFPGTAAATNAERMISAFRKQAHMAVGKPFPDFSEKDLEGQPISVAKYKGKVVLVDFWATWCGPCVSELPNVLEAYKKYHDRGFEIIGISLDKDREKLTSFLKQKGMTWPQYFDGKGWECKLAQEYGVNSIPATYLLDGNGTVISKDLRGTALEEALAKALETKK